ncbi:MAG: hypothetical protein QOG11_137 [Solirubrobacteraceae bacterium]|jgi:hypothetical protein|nr:hypothetical protein [Solirubrobacteraceae bacterium]
MSTLDIVLLAIAAVLVVLVLVGTRIARRRQEFREAALREKLAAANEALADAHASDNGWERASLEQAARDAHSGPVESLHLVQVVDRPGTDADEAVFQVVGEGGRISEVRLGRVGDRWVPQA